MIRRLSRRPCRVLVDLSPGGELLDLGPLRADDEQRRLVAVAHDVQAREYDPAAVLVSIWPCCRTPVDPWAGAWPCCRPLASSTGGSRTRERSGRAPAKNRTRCGGRSETTTAPVDAPAGGDYAQVTTGGRHGGDLHVAARLEEVEGDAPAVRPPVREETREIGELSHLRAVRSRPEQRVPQTGSEVNRAEGDRPAAPGEGGVGSRRCGTGGGQRQSGDEKYASPILRVHCNPPLKTICDIESVQMLTTGKRVPAPRLSVREPCLPLFSRYNGAEMGPKTRGSSLTRDASIETVHAASALPGRSASPHPVFSLFGIAQSEF